MKKLSIYEVTVPMESQEQCDRMKQLCIDNGLPIEERYDSFEFTDKYKYFEYEFGNFEIWESINPLNTQITESEFIELLKTIK